MYKKFFILLFALYCSLLTIVAQQSQSLDYYISQGIKNSPLLKDYNYRIQSNYFDSLKLRTQLKPQAYANGQIMIPPTFNGYGYDKAITNGGNYSALVGVSQNIFNRKFLSPQYSEININSRSLVNSTKITEKELRKSITDLYLSALSDYNEIILNRNIIKLSNQQSGILKQLVEHGIYKQSDYLSLLIESQTQKTQLSQLEIKYRTDINDMNVICGIADTNTYVLILPAINAALKNDINIFPLFLQYRIDSLKLSIDRAVINSRYRPKLNLFADAGLLSSDVSNLNKNLGFSFGLNFSMPLYDGKQRYLDYKKIDISEKTRINYKDFFKSQYNQQVYTLRKNLYATRDLIKQLQNQLELSESLIEDYKQLLERGEVNITDLILSYRNNINIRITLNQQQIKELQIINEINYWNQ